MLLKERRERRQGRRLKQLLNRLKKEKILEIKRRNTRSSFWRNRLGRSYGNVKQTVCWWIRIIFPRSCSELHSLYISLATFDSALQTKEQDSQSNYNVILLLVHWARLLLKSNNTFPLYWRWPKCIWKYKFFRFAMEMQQWFPSDTAASLQNVILPCCWKERI